PTHDGVADNLRRRIRPLRLLGAKMPDVPATPLERAEPLPERSGGDQHRLWPEVWVVLVLGVFYPFSQAVTALCWPEMWKPPSFTADACSLIAVSLSTSVVVLYLMSRSGDSWEHFGLQSFRWVSDPLLGLMLWLLGHVASMRLGSLYDMLDAGTALKVDCGGSYPRPEGTGEYLLLTIFCACNGFGEELVLRGYLLPRFERL